MTHYRVHLESSAAVGVEIAVEAANEDEAAQAVERMLSNGQLDPYTLVDELLKPSPEATDAYAKRTGQPITYVTIELDENGYEIVDEFEPTLEESVLQTLGQHHAQALGSDAAYPDDPATKLAKDMVRHGTEYLRGSDACVLTVSHAEHATILAALRFWQANGQGDPANRKDEFHDIATNADQVISLDDRGIDELCERIN